MSPEGSPIQSAVFDLERKLVSLRDTSPTLFSVHTAGIQENESPGFTITPEPWFEALWTVEIWMLRAANLMFLLFAAYLTLRFLLRREPWGFDLSVIAIVLASSVAQGLVELGGPENSRYFSPTSPLVLYIVVVSVWRLLPALPRGLNPADLPET